MARKAKDEPYHQMMKSRALTLFCPYEDCINHKKKANGNIIFIRRYGTGETQNLLVVCLVCCKFAMALYPDSTHSSKDKYLLPVTQSSLMSIMMQTATLRSD